MEEQEIDFRDEAQGVIKDIAFSVSQISVSEKLPSSRESVFLNIETKENICFCVQLCIQGFRVVSNTFDFCSFDEKDSITQNTPFYETIYALLDTISPGYSQMFGNELSRKLSELQQKTSSH
ncbi:predicted protein [Nematostella vectensis]|uniref:GSKIP domain-containing protein n=1 Tax=Nematostella vectensis TaxID=45351 RepID=A7SRB6_NEMVE|nr:GSK3-beta interaction protein [Nematostella vectensis]EDO33748.1 predicted protein [Nematostella vectensis]|eukprot:XP_001625848.1 predicted protein [Nematostella vectensis]